MDMSSALATWEYQKALYDVLKVSNELQVVVNGVFDLMANPNTEYPYVVVGECAEADLPMQHTEARELTSNVHVFSAYRGKKEVVSVGDLIVGLLHRRILAMTGWAMVLHTYMDTQMLSEPGPIFHGIFRFRARVQAAQ